MIKSIVVAHRKTGLSQEEYNKYWLEKHGPLAANDLTPKNSNTLT